jgi:pyridoxal 5'-phosphate synthase pdxS subunit
MRRMNEQIEELVHMKHDPHALKKKALEFRAPIALVEKTANLGRLPVVNFAAGGIAIPADAALMMQLGADGVFVGSGIFKSENPEKYAKAIVEATRNFDKPEIILKVSKGLGESMKGTVITDEKEKMQIRGV